jgi:predicted transcriptional regulator
MKLDSIDDIVLKGIWEGKSILEICKNADRAPAAIHYRLKELERNGYITPPPKPNMARSRKVTQSGENYLVGNGLIPMTDRIFSNPR